MQAVAVAKELREYHAAVYRSLRSDKSQPREAKSPVADMALRAAEEIESLVKKRR